MNLQQIGARVAHRVGRNNALVRLLRPAYESLLDRRGGFRRTVNGAETFYIDPRHRGLFPESYEPATYEFLRQSIGKASICLDIGAHVGIYALSLARWVGDEGHVYAFEPSPATRGVLEGNIKRNSFEKRITVVPKGVSDHVTEATFFAADLAGFSRLGKPNPERPENHRSFTVPITTIDQFCAEQNVRPDWMLIDIEGYEVAALRGARATIASRNGGLGIVVEMHPFLWESAGTSVAEFRSLLGELGLRARGLSGQADIWAENGQVVVERMQG
jgi:FkbM family methyltransferase